VECATCENMVCRNGVDCTGRQDEIAALYNHPAVEQMARAAAEIETRFYGEACRLEELIEFAKRMGYRRLGVAFCIGLSEEAKLLMKPLERQFDVSTVCCKVCGLTDDSLRDLKESKGMSRASCNPVGQAQTLNDDQTDLNIIVGLCIGHDILFTQHSKAPVTTLIVKDRVLAHNPAGALYSRYLRRRLERRQMKRGEGTGE